MYSPEKDKSCSLSFKEMGFLQLGLSNSNLVSWDRNHYLEECHLFSPISMANAENKAYQILQTSFLHRMNLWMLAGVSRGDDSFSAIINVRRQE